MKESQEIKEYLELDSVEKFFYGSKIKMVKEDFTVVFTSIGGRIRVDFIPPEKHYVD